MFGDKLLAGYYEQLPVDSKNRVFLPSTTDREIGDLIFVIYDEPLGIYKLYNKVSLEKMFEGYNKLVLEAKTEEERIHYEKMYLNFCKSVLKESRVDVQGRITLSGIVTSDDVVSLIGRGDHMVLERKKKQQ